MAFSILVDALHRIEHKVDLIMQHLKVTVQPMNAPVRTCPVCKQLIQYKLELEHGLVSRSCGCSTGKTVFKLQPTTQGEARGQGSAYESEPDSADAGRAARPKNRPRSQAR